MRWFLCGISFALAVGLAIGTAGIRAENIRHRQVLEREYRRLEARAFELRRLSVQAMEQATPERLATSLRALIQKRRSRSGEVQAWQ